MDALRSDRKARIAAETLAISRSAAVRDKHATVSHGPAEREHTEAIREASTTRSNFAVPEF